MQSSTLTADVTSTVAQTLRISFFLLNVIIKCCFKVMYSYWPRTNAAGKVKRGEMPDKESWKRYKIRVFSYAGNFSYMYCMSFNNV